MNFEELYRKIVSLDKPVSEGLAGQYDYDNQQPAEYPDECTGYVRSVEEVFLELPPELDSKIPGNWFNITYEFDRQNNLVLHEVSVYSDKANDYVDISEHKEALTDIIWQWIDANDMDNYAADCQSAGSNELYESSMNECGCDGMSDQPAQQDSVNMNVSINGQGANGIRDLMNILRNIDDTKSAEIPHDMSHNDQEPTIVIGNDEEPEEYDDEEDDVVDAEFISHDEHGEAEPEMDFDFDEMYDQTIEEEIPDSYENSVDGAGGIPKIFKVAAVTTSGDDINKSKKMYAKSNDGDNGMAVSESLVRNLHNLYNEVKHR